MAPNVLLMLFYKIFDMLRFFSRIPTRDGNGVDTTINIYRKVFEAFTGKAREANEGVVPNWLETAEVIFDYGVKVTEQGVNYLQADVEESSKFRDVFSGKPLNDLGLL